MDHVLVPVDPREDRSWLQSAPEVPTDNAHAHDGALAPIGDSPEHWSQALKRLKPRVLQRLIDTHKYRLPATLPHAYKIIRGMIACAGSCMRGDAGVCPQEVYGGQAVK